jgi:hypothetical protein
MFALPGAGVAHASDNGNTTGNRNISLGSGNTITAPISVPVNVCGVSGAVGGFSNSGCKGGSSSAISGVGGHSDNGNVTPPGCTANCAGTRRAPAPPPPPR